MQRATWDLGRALLRHFSEKLPISRLQRDLTDSTVLRNVGAALGHLLLALKNLQKGMDKVMPDEEVIRTDLRRNWQVISEAWQTRLRKEGVENAYEIVKKIILDIPTEGQKVPTREELMKKVDELGRLLKYESKKGKVLKALEESLDDLKIT